MNEMPAETRIKMEYLLYFNLAGILLFFLLIALRLFGSSNIYLLAGDLNLLLIVLLSLLMIKLNKPTFASCSIYLLPISVILYHVIENQRLGIAITSDSLFATLAFLIFGIMFSGAFAIRKKQIVIFGLLALITLIFHYVYMTNSPFGIPPDRENFTLLFAALLILFAALLAALLTRRISTELIKVSERSHRETETKYLSLFSNMMDGFSLQKVILNEEGKPINSVFVEVNDAFEQFAGRPRDEIIGKNASDIVPGVTSPESKWLKVFSEVALTGKEVRFEEYARHYKRWLDVYAFSPEPGYFITIFRDITLSRETAEALRISERKNKAIIEALPDHIFIIDEAGNMSEVLTESDTSGNKTNSGNKLSIYNLSYPVDTINRILASARLALSAGTLQTIEYSISPDGDTAYFEARLISLNGSQVLVVNRNITYRKLSEIKLVKAKEKAEESDRLKTAFLANMSHEVLTPMNAIMGFSQILSEESIAESERREFAGLIRTSGHLLIGLINDIMDLSRIEAGETNFNITQFELKPLLKELHDFYSNELIKAGKTGITLSWTLDESNNIREIESDRGRLQQVLSNLLDNAVKFTRSGFIKFGCESSVDGSFIFFVGDSGIGIPREKHNLIFERFRQVEEDYDRTYGGTGIGLALVKKIVELLGGTISLDSAPGRGSEFRFTLNTIHSNKSPKYILPVEEPKFVNDFDWSGKTILVTEDILTNFIFLQRVISNLNAKVLHAQNGRQAVELAESGEHIDLILMDLQMPEMNGIEAFNEIRQNQPGIKIILQTAYADKDEKSTYKKMGFNGFITKPIRVETLISLMNSVLVS
jgi:PAS domain S-box-containing protein